MFTQLRGLVMMFILPFILAADVSNNTIYSLKFSPCFVVILNYQTGDKSRLKSLEKTGLSF